MKVVMTLLVRDEEDIVDAQIAFHLNAGVDFVIATDNLSEDGTTEILESYARAGYLHLIREPGTDHRQGEWVTRMARLAASDFGADWIINSDGDEFWWPRGGSIKEVLAAVPPRFGAVRGMWRHFTPRPDGDDFFAERMTVRVCNPGAHSNSPYSPRFKTAHRADPGVQVGEGNHQAFGTRLLPLRGWYPIDVLHFPIRSLGQCEHKYRIWWELYLRGGANPRSVYGVSYDLYRQGRMHEFYESFLIDDAALERGQSDGTVAVDTRLRDALRRLRAKEPRGPGRFDLPPDAEPLGFTDCTVDEGYLAELGRLTDGEAVVVTQKRVEGLEARVAALETTVSSRLRQGLSTPLRRLARR
jgi:hypothetical protein